MSVPLLLVLAWGGAPAVAVGEPSGSLTDLAGQERSERAAPGTAHLRADSAEDGVVRRTARLADVQHAAGSTPSQQIAVVDVAVDLEAQTLGAAATLNGVPDGSVVNVYVGTWDGSTCNALFVAAGIPGEGAAQFVDGEAVPATATVQGNALAISTAAHPRLRTTLFECAFARVTVNAPGGATLSTALPDDLTDTYKPVLEVEPDDRMVGAKKGRWARVSLEVRNTSRGPASGVRLTASGTGIEIRTSTIEVGALDDRSTEYLDLDVRLEQPKRKKGKKPKSPKPRTLTLTLTAPGAATATATTTVVLTPRPTTPKKLTGTYWWGWEDTNLQSSAGWINHAIWFVDAKWAYTGWADGKKPRCSASVKECLRYSYNPRTGMLKLGTQRAKVTSEGFSVKHPAYKDAKLRLEPLTLPKKGTKLAVDLYHQNWSGYCAITCTSYTDYLTMDASGKFVEGGFSVGSWPGLGQSWSSAPADQRGTYKVVRTGIIEMSYADGTRKRQVVGVQHDPSGKPNPAAAGVVLGDVNFYD
ncbi:hypothetical protein SAMN04489844_0030 [Nocardioides exalbidus]|uniref:Uncharacterized protein n=1 Tax=Nocardioides exalbidus TaxID=402596 RepID=A0A1H4I3T8_9ACTN|nr:hypothetical protein SAMN04489844_0030 [Nocardioides exalbidus]